MFRIFKYGLVIVLFPAAVLGQTGYLTVDCPANTTIYIDSVLVARQPFEDLALLPGKYLIGLDPANDFSWQRRTTAQEIEIKPFERVFVDLHAVQPVAVYSNPIGSDVFAGKRYLGKTPVFLNRAEIDTATLRVKHAGYRAETFSLKPDLSEYKIDLLPMDEGDETRVREAFLSGVEVNWFKESLVLTSFVSSWAAFFFKRKADDLYLQYEGASIPSRIDYFYNETEKYDRYSEVALGISAVSLGVYLFILITE